MVRLRKKDIVNYYKNRQDLNDDDAVDYFCHPDVLGAVDSKGNNTDGLKLNTYFLLEKLGAARAWDLIRTNVVRKSPTPRICELIGLTIRNAYNQALDDDASTHFSTDSRPKVRKSEIADGMMRPLIESCILVQRKYAEKFILILKGSVEDRKDKFSRMLFNVSEPLVWRYLDAANWHVRAGAYSVQTLIYPPSCGDSIRQTEYMSKHHNAFISGLKDECVDICIQSVESACSVVGLWSKEISGDWVEKIFKELALLAADESAEIRAKLYLGLRHFVTCSTLAIQFERLLKKICPSGIDDVSDRVRCNVFRLLNLVAQENEKLKIVSHSDDKPSILKLRPVLFRLDFEEGEAIEKEISLLLYQQYIKGLKQMSKLYTRVSHFCKINRNACLDLHRLFFTAKIMDIPQCLAYLRFLLDSGMRAFKFLVEKQEEVDGETSTQQVNDESAEDHESLRAKFNDFKNVLDCAIVLFTTIRGDPKFEPGNVEAMQVSRLFILVVDKIFVSDPHGFDRQPKHPGLFDSAFLIMSTLRTGGQHLQQVRQGTTRMIKAGQCNVKWIETFGLLDMEQLLNVIRSGLKQMEKSSKSAQAAATIQKGGRNRSEFFANEKTVIETLDTVLASQPCQQYILDTYIHCVDQLIASLTEISENFVLRIREGEDINTELLIECVKTLNVLQILKHTHETIGAAVDEGKSRKRGRHAATPMSRRSAAMYEMLDAERRTDPLLSTIHWFQRHLSANERMTANTQMLELFFYVLNLHFRAYKHRKAAVEEALSLIVQIHDAYRAQPNTRSMIQLFNECRQVHGKHALEFAEENPRNLFDVPEADEETEGNEENEMPIDHEIDEIYS
ncbi:hypothetical protein M3Y96_00262400 [Aphelenchoides besseyi]|nr:hypothetical protein M3Y96_00262400 [Aphelenchoides besseyi]